MQERKSLGRVFIYIVKKNVELVGDNGWFIYVGHVPLDRIDRGKG
jgi:hypothetical protein